MTATRTDPDPGLAGGLDQGRVRRMNTAVVLRALAAAGEASLAELGQSTGLSRRTLQAILDELRRAGWALESETASGGAGRPAKSYAYVADHRVAVALRLDTHTAYAMIVDLHGRVLGRAQTALGDDYLTPELALQHLAAVTGIAREQAGLDPRVLAAGTIAAGGVIDARTGVVVRLINAPAWTGFPLAETATALLGFPVTADNDANLAAFAESRAGAAAEHDDVAWLVHGNRTGAGFLLRGAIHHGHRGAAGELVESHVLGLTLSDGDGFSLLSSPIAADRTAALALTAAARAGDDDALALARDFAAELADVIDVLAWTIAPELVVLGGGLEDASELLIPLVRERLRERGDPGIRVLPTALGADAVLLGAAHVARDAVSASVLDTIMRGAAG
ncbi:MULTISPECIES: ROK family protein [Microbacterium]|uniref:ROK family protein n=1 Tax=Microbacterium TaxID=33882 RepID=UPI002781A803|nr:MULTISPECIES: ROK family protein [Microbacterium]MDQ1085422.1 putative NBD/HSP70 family sugar kinase/biotin operon repressor [Microbacterium sp. SORGH_AS_0344]MDQ1169272.1 putative NBD/HSP70 family sugar kinase/biotin operon repressor [Microbacterium proteolyticum]